MRVSDKRVSEGGPLACSLTRSLIYQDLLPTGVASWAGGSGGLSLSTSSACSPRSVLRNENSTSSPTSRVLKPLPLMLVK